MKPRIPYICGKILFLFSIWSKCGSKGDKIFEKKESVEILKILDLIEKT